MTVCWGCGAERVAAREPCPACGQGVEVVEGFLAFAPELARAGDGFDPGRFEFLSGIQDRHFWFRARNRLIAWAVGRFAPRATALLELGCGTGIVLDHLARSLPRLEEIVGADLHVEGLAFARRRLGDRADLVQMDARRMPFRREFDVVGCFDVLEHVSDDRVVLEGLRLALQPGGVLALTVPQHPWLWSRHDVAARHLRRYRARDLDRLLTAAGFKIAYRTSYTTLLLPPMIVSRLKERSRLEGETEGFGVPGALNRLFERVMDLERAMIRRGVRLPVGGSLLALARVQ